MNPPALSDQQQAEAQRLVEALRPHTETLLQQAAALLVANSGPNSFGSTEFQLRDLLLACGSQLLQTSLAQKKTATRVAR